MTDDGTLLQVNLRVDYPNKPMALRDVAFSLKAGEVLGLVGESGSGKSTIAIALLRLLHWKGGRAKGQIVRPAAILWRSRRKKCNDCGVRQ